MNRERDPANPTPEELRETAASEGLMATEEETDPEFEDDRDAADVPDPEAGRPGVEMSEAARLIRRYLDGHGGLDRGERSPPAVHL